MRESVNLSWRVFWLDFIRSIQAPYGPMQVYRAITFAQEQTKFGKTPQNYLCRIHCFSEDSYRNCVYTVHPVSIPSYPCPHCLIFSSNAISTSPASRNGSNQPFSRIHFGDSLHIIWTVYHCHKRPIFCLTKHLSSCPLRTHQNHILDVSWRISTQTFWITHSGDFPSVLLDIEGQMKNVK